MLSYLMILETWVAIRGIISDIIDISVNDMAIFLYATKQKNQIDDSVKIKLFKAMKKATKEVMIAWKMNV